MGSSIPSEQFYIDLEREKIFFKFNILSTAYYFDFNIRRTAGTHLLLPT
jgi:hypothetical protein